MSSMRDVQQERAQEQMQDQLQRQSPSDVPLPTTDMYSNSVTTTSTTSLAAIGSSIGTMVEISAKEVKKKAETISAGEVAQNVRDGVFSLAMGERQEKSTGAPGDCNSHESKLIDNMPAERIAEFLQEKHKSNAAQSSENQ